MADLANGPQEVFPVYKFLESGVEGDWGHGTRAICVGALTSEVEAVKAYKIVNNNAKGREVEAPIARPVIVVDGNVFFDPSLRASIPASMITETAEEAIALHVQMLIGNETVPRSEYTWTPGPGVYPWEVTEPYSANNIPISRTERKIAKHFGASLV